MASSDSAANAAVAALAARVREGCTPKVAEQVVEQLWKAGKVIMKPGAAAAGQARSRAAEAHAVVLLRALVHVAKSEPPSESPREDMHARGSKLLASLPGALPSLIRLSTKGGGGLTGTLLLMLGCEGAQAEAAAEVIYAFASAREYQWQT
ncbi:hypothetical protein FOA52_005083 [Chlamydomonas sp. UWO 241]|nr:hypothetical protein FOA52_005083 [Chlamydomonas sp. UWO 241]